MQVEGWSWVSQCQPAASKRRHPLISVPLSSSVSSSLMDCFKLGALSFFLEVERIVFIWSHDHVDASVFDGKKVGLSLEIGPDTLVVRISGM